MLKHVVMWKLKDQAMGKTRIENAEIMKQLLEDLPSGIEQLKSAEVGLCILKGGPSVSDVVLITEFENEEDLKTYAEHPDHQRVVNFIVNVTDERRVVDYRI